MEKILLLETIHDRNFTYSHKMILEDDQLKNILLKTEYTPEAKEKIYIYPEADVPKFKVKPFCDKYDVSLVRDKTKASRKFITKKFIESIRENSNIKYNFIDITFFKNWFKGVIYDTDPKYSVFLKVLENYKQSYVYFTDTVMKQLSEAYTRNGNYSNPFGMPLLHSDKYIQTCYLAVIDDETDILIKDIEGSDNLYTTTCLLKYMNGSAVMDGQMYENIKNLFLSKDTSNHVIAIESMANCDYEKSCVYLLLLIEEFRTKIRDNKASKHVNFSTLTSYFDISLSDCFTVDEIIDTLTARNLLTPGRLNIIMKDLQRKVESDSPEYYDIVVIKPTSKVLEKVKISPEEIVDIVDAYNEELDLDL